MVGYTIVCAPAATGLSEAVKRLKRECKGTVAHEDVEKILCESREATEALSSLDIQKPEGRPKWPQMSDITWNLPRENVIKLWCEALRDAVHRLQTSNTDLKILSCHLILYGGRRDEFYSPLDVRSLLKTKGDEIIFGPSHVLLLIDDIYDSYLRLTKEGEIFDVNNRVEPYLEQIWDDEGNSGPEAFRPELRSSLTLQWKLGILTNLLSWRHSEILMAEALANQAGAEFLLWGVKQPVQLAATWLSTMNPKSVYLSHPISRPRRKKRQQGAWPEVVFEFNQLQERLFQNGLTAIMPTAIDEFRIRRRKPKKASLGQRSAELEERWPVPTEDVELLLYSFPPDCADMNHLRLFTSPEMPVPDPAVTDVQLRALENHISFQVSSRDHLLVSHTNYLLVFRPFYRATDDAPIEFSDGVKAEIDHWTIMARSNVKRRAAFIHLLEDVKTFWLFIQSAAARQRGLFIDQLIEDEIVSILASRLGRDSVATRRILKAVKAKKVSTTLDKGATPDANRVRGLLPEVTEQARIIAVGQLLTGTPISPQVGLWILNGSAELEACCAQIAVFFKDDDSPSPEEWKQALAKGLFANKSAAEDSTS